MNVTITSENPLIIHGNEPQRLNFTSITFEIGAEMQILSDVSIYAQTITFKGNNRIRVLGENGKNAVAGSADLNGGNGTNSPNVTFNVNVFSGEVTISVVAGNGGSGADGCPNGGNGGNAGNGGVVTVAYGSMNVGSGVHIDTPIPMGGAPGRGIGLPDIGIVTSDGNWGAKGTEGKVIVSPTN